MHASWFGMGILLLGCVGVLAVAAGVGVLLFILLRRKKEARGFEVLPKEESDRGAGA